MKSVMRSEVGSYVSSDERLYVRSNVRSELMSELMSELKSIGQRHAQFLIYMQFAAMHGPN